MNLLERFAAYAAAFEETYRDDDWSRLEGYFTDDAVYEVTGEPPLGGRWEGRDAVIHQFHESVDAFDRQFEERILAIRGEPRLDGDTVSADWEATYRSKALPDLTIRGTETAVFDGDRIRLLRDVMEEGTEERVREYLKQFFSGPQSEK